MATYEGLSKIQDLLHATDRPFENIAVEFKGLVPEQKRFEAACALMALLEDDKSQTYERVVALYILYNLYNVVPIRQNPFLILFLNLYKSLSSNFAFVEKNYDLLVEFRVEALILANKGSQLADKTPGDVYQQFVNGDKSLIIDMEEINIAEFECYIKQEFDIRPSKEEHPERHDDSWTTIEDSEVPHASLLRNEIPNQDQNHDHEQDHEQDIEQDYDIITEFTGQDGVRVLMDKALQGALTIPEEEFILGQFEKNDKLVYQCDLVPEKFPDLVENNSRIAVEALLQLKSSPQVGKFLKTLVTINDLERSQQSSVDPVNRMRSSMEVVNGLTSFPLPPEFLHKYLTNCVRACEASQNRDTQDRQVRLICVFFQSLIRNNIVDVNRFFVEIPAFCLQFSRIREAADLYRLLLNLQRNSAVDNVMLNADIVEDINGELNNLDDSGQWDLS
ncbi:hypothetical protein RclHR1_07140007 [Rhizophagus clarus]|uniref:CCR4-NOT transcription complex subunit 11 n=1 Tax=Rhizophagus clarus TaxID=94130 RepID=A0A2Z6SB21_9GLOM|nr:hypothetical protein RclHR1_07140007 [Rhizophagus clarus]GES73599.1 CCR4-NOT transcription complex subunit 11 [Rhizophagus clarus]GES87145.1 CCR4-NOT transcription complex subunit 11 [Rhizophagus clarus]